MSLAQGLAASDAALAAIGRKHNASAAQVALKWLLDQDGVAAIPKASRAESQQANLDALKLKLDDADRQAIAALPKDKRCVNPRAMRRLGIEHHRAKRTYQIVFQLVSVKFCHSPISARVFANLTVAAVIKMIGPIRSRFGIGLSMTGSRLMVTISPRIVRTKTGYSNLQIHLLLFWAPDPDQ